MRGVPNVDSAQTAHGSFRGYDGLLKHEVEADLMSFQDVIIFHTIDRCTRWYQSMLVKNKTETDLIRGSTCWFKLRSDLSQKFLEGHGVDHPPRGKSRGWWWSVAPTLNNYLIV